MAKLGRPKLFGKKRVWARLTPAQARELRALRRDLGLSESDVLRALLDLSAAKRAGA